MMVASGGRPGAVLFDLDGTLVDSAAAIRTAWAEWARRVDLGEGFVFDRHGVPANEVVRELLPEYQHRDALRLVNELEVATTSGIVAMPGAVFLLSVLEDAAIPWAVVTSCTRELAKARAGAAGIRLPEVTVTAEDVLRGKPEPDCYTLAALRLGFPATECAVVEDSPAGASAGLRAGCTVYAVTSTHRPEELAGAIVATGLRELSSLWETGR